MLQSAVQAFTAFVVTVINSVPHHKVLIPVDCFGLFWLVPFYAHMHTNKHTTKIYSICLLHINTDYHTFIAGVFFMAGFYCCALGLIPVQQFSPSQNESDAVVALLEIVHLLCIRIPVKPAIAFHFKL